MTGKHVDPTVPVPVAEPGQDLYAKLIAYMVLGGHGPGTGRHETHVMGAKGERYVEGSLTMTDRALAIIPRIKEVTVTEEHNRGNFTTVYHYRVELA